MDTFVAIDFETADYGRDSACAIALVRVEGTKIVRKEAKLVRPPCRDFAFTHSHGITWSEVALEKPFRDVWRALESMLDGADFLAAHNASFDKNLSMRTAMRRGCDRQPR